MRAQVTSPGGPGGVKPEIVNVEAFSAFGGAAGRFWAGIKTSFLVLGVGLLISVVFPPFIVVAFVGWLVTPFIAIFSLSDFYDIECPYCITMTRAALRSSNNSCSHCKQSFVFNSVS